MDRDIKPDWLEKLQHALNQAQNPNTASYLQLATYDAKQGPQVRTLVFRGFSRQHELLMVTEAASAKVQQLKAHGRAQIAWYFTDSRQQFRLSGDIIVIDQINDDQSLRQKVWQSISPNAKRSFFAITQGGSELQTNEFVEATQAPDNFVVLALKVSEVDHLDIATQPHQRRRYHINDSLWESHAVDP